LGRPARLDKPLSLVDAAAHVGLSSGRARHLFAESTGLPFRTYLLWLRLTKALELFSAGRVSHRGRPRRRLLRFVAPEPDIPAHVRHRAGLAARELALHFKCAAHGAVRRAPRTKQEQVAEVEATVPRGAIAGARYPAAHLAALDSEKR
jgi:AraC-like DNA-binding protein